MKVNTFIIGAPKCGTTSLCRFFESHPDIMFSSPKETNFFSSEEIVSMGTYYKEHICTTLEEYEKYFQSYAGEKIIGDASVSYMHYKNTAANIYNYNADAKIIGMLRNPIDRAFSHYLMDFRLGYVNASFEEIFKHKEKFPMHFRQYFNLGLYDEQLEQYQRVFPSTQIKIITSNMLTDLAVAESFADFLSVDSRGFLAFEIPKKNVYKEYNFLTNALYKNFYVRRLVQNMLPKSISSIIKKTVLKKTVVKPQLGIQTREMLEYFFYASNQALKSKYGIDITKW